MTQTSAMPLETDETGRVASEADAFRVERFVGRKGLDGFRFAPTQEAILLLVDNPAEIARQGEGRVIPPRSVTILPPADYWLNLAPRQQAVLVTTRRPPEAGPGYTRRGDANALLTYDVDAMTPHAGNPRLKIFQSAVTSINWVEYGGPRDRARLSPHAHEDFEQGGLALRGAFVHHLRLPWGKDADAWEADRHIAAPSPSLTVIPPRWIHTSEGVGAAEHLLIDVFSPPRRDFREKGWVLNASDYREIGG